MAKKFQKWCGLRLQTVLCVLCLAVSVVRAQKQIVGRSNLMLSNAYGKIGLVVSPMEPTDETVMTLKPGGMFRVYAGTLEGASFYGKLAVALVRNETQVVSVFAMRDFSASYPVPVTDIVCVVPDDADIQEGDMIRLLTTPNNGVSFDKIYPKVGAGDGLVEEVPAVDYKLPLFKIDLPMDVPGVTVRKGDTALWPDRALHGTNFFFYVTVDDPENFVVSVKANGNGLPLDAQGGYYAIGNVDRDYDIEIITYNRHEVTEYAMIESTEDTRVIDLLSDENLACLKGLKVNGVLKEEDFEVFRTQMPSLELLDMSEVTRLLTYDNQPQVYLPERALKGNSTLKEVRVPEFITGLASEAFRDMGSLELAVLPPNLCNFGFNEFFNCPKLMTVWVEWNPFEHNETLGFPVPACAFNGTPYQSKTLLIVPKGCLGAYQYTAKWGLFKNMREESPTDALRYKIPFEKYLSVGSVKSRQVMEVFLQEGGCRVVAENAESMAVKVFDLAGREMAGGTISGGSAFIALAPGFYLVHVGDAASKIMVR